MKWNKAQSSHADAWYYQEENTKKQHQFIWIYIVMYDGTWHVNPWVFDSGWKYPQGEELDLCTADPDVAKALAVLFLERPS